MIFIKERKLSSGLKIIMGKNYVSRSLLTFNYIIIRNILLLAVILLLQLVALLYFLFAYTPV